MDNIFPFKLKHQKLWFLFFSFFSFNLSKPTMKRQGGENVAWKESYLTK